MTVLHPPTCAYIHQQHQLTGVLHCGDCGTGRAWRWSTGVQTPDTTRRESCLTYLPTYLPTCLLSHLHMCLQESCRLKASRGQAITYDSILTTHHLLLTTHSPLTAGELPFEGSLEAITYYLPLTTYYLLPLTTYYLLLTTYDLLLTTYHLPLTTGELPAV